MSPRTSPRTHAAAVAVPHPQKLGFNADAMAIVLALLLAALVRLNVLHGIGW